MRPKKAIIPSLSYGKREYKCISSITIANKMKTNANKNYIYLCNSHMQQAIGWQPFFLTRFLCCTKWRACSFYPFYTTRAAHFAYAVRLMLKTTTWNICCCCCFWWTRPAKIYTSRLNLFYILFQAENAK